MLGVRASCASLRRLPPPGWGRLPGHYGIVGPAPATAGGPDLIDCLLGDRIAPLRPLIAAGVGDGGRHGTMEYGWRLDPTRRPLDTPDHRPERTTVPPTGAILAGATSPESIRNFCI